MDAVAVHAESNPEGTILFAFRVPGACGWGDGDGAATARLREVIRTTLVWLDGHGLPMPEGLPAPDGGRFAEAPGLEFDLVERVPTTGDPRQCDSEGFFSYDDRPFDDRDLANTGALLRCSRSDLLTLTEPLPEAALDRRLVADRRTVREVLDHVALAEHWYLTRIDHPVAVPDSWREYPDGTWTRLAAVRADVRAVLAALRDVPERERARSAVVDGERWSARKVLRRLVWHELLHYRQLRRLVPKLAGAGE